jgi:hypothetical protein
LRQSDAVGDFARGFGCVDLQAIEDLDVEPVEFGRQDYAPSWRLLV